jgi:hypothetical protein
MNTAQPARGSPEGDITLPERVTCEKRGTANNSIKKNTIFDNITAVCLYY